MDKRWLSLLAKRLELVAEVGEVKSQYGLRRFTSGLESAMLASPDVKRRLRFGVPPDLRSRGRSASRVMRELIPAKRQRLQNPAAESAAGGHRRRRWARWAVCLRRC
ncbi:chorismate mutase [Klebsiella pneumoniae subsp. pneumoniae]|nr:chorismate mutase [Klebsiella pneumoniae subsp. pneumoniae]